MCMCMAMYLNMRVRSDINYNQLNIPPPNADDFETKDQENNFDDIFNSLGICYGDSCCGEDTRWDGTRGTCIPIDLAISPSSAPSLSTNSDTSILGNNVNTQEGSDDKSTVSPSVSTVSPSVSTSAPLSISASMKNTIEGYYKRLGDTPAFYEEVHKLTDTKLSNNQLKEKLKDFRLDTFKQYNASQDSSKESFATYNEIYNINNELLPCNLAYPYKDSSNAQPNDNLLYMKTYK